MELFIMILEFLRNFGPEVVTIATGVTMLTPSRSDNRALDSVLGVFNLLSGNFGRNKNADEK